MSEPTKAPHLSPDGKWRWDGIEWRPTTPDSGFAFAMRVFDYVVVGMICWVVGPIALALLLAVFAPTYWDPMFSSAVGIGLLTAGFAAICIGLALIWVARSLVRPSRGRLLAGVGILALAFMIQFFTLWIVLLSPALLIVLSPQQP